MRSALFCVLCVGLLGISITLTLSQECESVLDDNPIWSPDSESILFDSNRSGNNDVWHFDVTRRELINLTDHPASDVGAVWSPNGEMFAFVSDRSGESEIWIQDIESSNLYLVSEEIARNFGALHWSSDGIWLTFIAWEEYLIPNELWVLNVFTRQAINLSSDLNGDAFFQPRWINDTTLATIDDVNRLWIIEIDKINSNGELIVTYEDTPYVYMTYSANQSRLAYSTPVDTDSRWNVRVANIDTVEEPEFVFDSAMFPDISLDGNWLTYVERSQPFYVQTVNLLTEERVQLVDGGDDVILTPRWSPNNQMIAYVMVQLEVASSSIWLIDVETRETISLPNGCG